MSGSDLRATGQPAIASPAALQQAIDELRGVVAREAGNAGAWQRLGDLLGSAERLPEALDAYGRALSLEPRSLAVTMKAAIAAACLGRFRDARNLLEAVARLTQVNDGYFALYADVLEAQCDWAALASVASSWSRLAPDLPRPWDAQAKAAWETGRLHQAIALCRRAMTLVRPDAERLATLARICLNALEFDAAATALDEAEVVDPRNVHMLAARAGLLMFQGRFEEAAAYIRRCLAEDPNDVSALRTRSQLQRGRLSAEERDTLQQLARRQTVRAEHRISAAFTLGDCLDAEGEVDEAFAAYELAHRLAAERGRVEALEYDPAARAREVDFLLSHFAGVTVPLTEVAGPRPIFVVGMPRSGTTLIEGVLGAHSRVLACGERMALRQVMRDYLAQAQGVPGIPRRELQRLAQLYFQGLPDLRGADHITDKNPWNFDAIGLILSLFPQAHIVHVRRNPVETGLSIFRNEFTKFQPFTQRLDHIGHYYGEYARLMKHWERLAGDRLTTVQYESFAADFDQAAPALLRSCGLEWQEACLHFQTSPRAIATLSTVQAREPVADRSGRAQRYLHHLAPLKAALAAAGVDLQTGELSTLPGR